MGKQITPKEAGTLCDNFDTRYAELSKLIKKDDNRSVLFSLQEIKNYINYLENAKTNVDGIRVYFGAHDAKDGGLATVFLAPTQGGEDDKSLNCLNYGANGNPPFNKY